MVFLAMEGRLEICSFPLLWLLAFTTAFTTVQATMMRERVNQEQDNDDRGAAGEGFGGRH